MMGASPSRIRLGDKRQEGQRKLGGRQLIVSPHLERRGHQTSISSPSRVTPFGTRTSSTSSLLDRSWSTGTGIKKISSSMSSNITFGKNRFCSTYDTTRSSDDVYQRRSKETYWRCVTHRHAEDTSRHEKPRTRSCRAASTGPPSSRMLTVSTQSAYNVKQQ